MRKMIAVGAIGAISTAAVLLCVLTAVAQSGEYVDTPMERFGYSLALPKEFSPDGPIGDTTAWVYRPGPETAPPDAAAEKGAPLTIWVNRMPVETTNLKGLYEIGRKYDLDAPNAPNGAIRDLSLTNGYGYWYREADKSDPNALHRWIAKIFGNGAVYTVCLSGPFGEFAAWGLAYEQVIASFKLLPVKTK